MPSHQHFHDGSISDFEESDYINTLRSSYSIMSESPLVPPSSSPNHTNASTFGRHDNPPHQFSQPPSAPSPLTIEPFSPESPWRDQSPPSQPTSGYLNEPPGFEEIRRSILDRYPRVPDLETDLSSLGAEFYENARLMDLRISLLTAQLDENTRRIDLETQRLFSTPRAQRPHSKAAVLRFVQSLPEVPVDEFRMDCDICKSTYEKEPSFDGTLEKAVKLPCGHVFGDACLRNLLTPRVDGGWGDRRCPMCRREIVGIGNEDGALNEMS